MAALRIGLAIIAWAMALGGCDAAPATPPAPSAATFPVATSPATTSPATTSTATTATAPSPTPPPTPAQGEPVPTPEVPLSELLPAARPPLTLQHARSLGAEGAWAEAAAVYDAVLAAEPTHVRALAGRGFALSSWGEPRAVGHARHDLEAALAMAPKEELAAAIRFNLGNLEERVGHRERAAEHYRGALALRKSAQAAHALTRVGGDAKRAYGDGTRCTLEGPLVAERARSLPDAVTKIRTAQLEGSKPPPPPKGGDQARALLCGDACPERGAFVSTLGLADEIGDLMATTEAHLVVPGEGAVWVVPRLEIGNGSAARCPDEITHVEVDEVAGLVRARFTLLTNYWEECDEGGADCSPGCFWSERLDAVVWIAPTTGQYVVLRGHLMIPEPSADDPWERLEREPVLPPGVAYADAAGVHAHGCGLARDVALPSAP